jgi:mono/diheme cytochrome c family protein
MNRLFDDSRMRSAFVCGGTVVGVLLLFSAAIGQAQTPSPSSAPAPAAAGNVEHGKKLFNSVGCWMCHGYSAQGGTGPRIGPDPIALPAFTRYVRSPTRQMPPYTVKVLTDADLADIHAFLKTVPKPLDAASIPLLKGVD